MLTNPVVVSVVVMTVLALLKVNILIAIFIAAIVAGLTAGMPIFTTMSTLIGGMGGNSETALSYIMLGALATAISHTGIADFLIKGMSNAFADRKKLFVLIIAAIASLSQNLLPVHIAFIPILIPPLLGLMNKMKVDRRAVACALTFGLKFPYVVLSVGFGAIFHKIIIAGLVDNGVEANISQVMPAMIIPGLGMVVGLIIAIFFTYRKDRTYADKPVGGVDAVPETHSTKFTMAHWGALAGAVVAFAIQIIFVKMDWGGGLPLGALAALIVMMLFRSFTFKDMDDMMNGGIKLMGFIAFVMLIAAGYGAVLRETGAVKELVEASASILGGSKLISAFVMLLIGLLVTMGIGSSFSTIPIIATLFVPLGVELGFSPAAIIALVGTAGALGDAGSPASDSTLGPTSGLNADGQHDHIWDTCVPTFIHFNIPLIIFGVIAALIL
ncbi:Na+/H+ antiporter family protein [Microaceticoccus formicicus]|uniref:Na+/H+ antiporter family protein n=1 Tax=Microaceticoccus formicicus TaxID=3118105 RepID=UPI003CD01F05|nr:Na+/H+ antiporter NhaC family protein [Peptoniphilaceae bacterium AMB_02]